MRQRRKRNDAAAGPAAFAPAVLGAVAAFIAVAAEATTAADIIRDTPITAAAIPTATGIPMPAIPQAMAIPAITAAVTQRPAFLSESAAVVWDLALGGGESGFGFLGTTLSTFR